MADAEDTPPPHDEAPPSEEQAQDAHADPFLLVELDEEQEGAGDGLEIDDRQSEEIRKIFAATLPQYLEPVEEMTAQILRSGPTGETVDALQGTLSSLVVAASRVGYDQIVESLQAFNATIATLDTSETAPVPQEAREEVLEALIDLKDLAQQLGGGGGEAPAERSDTIFQALQGAEDLGDAVLQRLTAAGLTRVDQLRMAEPGEIAAVTGLGMEVVERLLKRAGVTPPSPASNVEELPLGADELRQLLQRKLQQQVEAEAAVGELRAEVQQLRAGIGRRREELARARRQLGELEERLGEAGARLAERNTRRGEVWTERAELARRYEETAERLRRLESRLQGATEEHRRLLEQDDRFGTDVSDLTARVKALLGRVGKGRETGDSIAEAKRAESLVKSDL